MDFILKKKKKKKKKKRIKLLKRISLISFSPKVRMKAK